MSDNEAVLNVVAFPKRERKRESAKSQIKRAPRINPKDRRIGRVAADLNYLLEQIAEIDWTTDEGVAALRRFNIAPRAAVMAKDAASYFGELARKLREPEPEPEPGTER
jgi:hypothetical protein